MSKFIEALQAETNLTKTENGGTCYKSTNSDLLDLFGTIGALRNRSADDVEAMFIKAFNEDKLLATKMVFYARDIRNGGLGERKTFRVILKFLANHYPNIVIKNMENIVNFGRADDLLTLIDTPVEKDMLNYVGEQLLQDILDMKANQPISLLGKWLPSINASSEKTRQQAKVICKYLNLSEKNYRLTLSALRSHLQIVETNMSAKKFDTIDYSKVPSIAMKNYRNAFYNRDEERFSNFVNAVAKGEAKVNASTLFPYDILRAMNFKGWRTFQVDRDGLLEAQWKALPNYVEGENNILVMADTSGSMDGQPMLTSVGLAMYFAERNKGAFANKFMTFSAHPEFVELKGSTVYEKVRCIKSIVEDTNIEKAFELVLFTAIQHSLKQEDMPKAIVVISDMEFNEATTDRGRMSFYDDMKALFESHGYQIPNVVFWNVESRQNKFQAFSEYKGVQLASGSSPSVFKSIIENIGTTPYEAMMKVLAQSAYECIIV